MNYQQDNPNQMYRLRDQKNGLWQIHSKVYGAFEGPANQIFPQAQKMGVHPYDLKLAINQLVTLNHDYADFGVQGRLIYTAKGKK